MLSWLRRRRDQAERIEAEANALIVDLGDRGYSEARRRAREASSNEMEREWSRVALAIARKTGKHVGLDTATRMAMEADFSGRRRRDRGQERAARRHRPDRPADVDRVGDPCPAALPDSVRRRRSRTWDIDLKGSQARRLRPLRGRPGSFRLRWPPRAIGFRLVDQDGQEIFGRDRR